MHENYKDWGKEENDEIDEPAENEENCTDWNKIETKKHNEIKWKLSPRILKGLKQEKKTLFSSNFSLSNPPKKKQKQKTIRRGVKKRKHNFSFLLLWLELSRFCTRTQTHISSAKKNTECIMCYNIIIRWKLFITK